MIRCFFFGVFKEYPNMRYDTVRVFRKFERITVTVFGLLSWKIGPFGPILRVHVSYKQKLNLNIH